MSTEPPPIFCSKCGTQAVSEALFCCKCGVRLLQPECVAPKVEETQKDHRHTEPPAVVGLEDGTEVGKSKTTDAHQASSFTPEVVEPKSKTASLYKALLERGETSALLHGTMLISLFAAGVDLLMGNVIVAIIMAVSAVLLNLWRSRVAAIVLSVSTIPSLVYFLKVGKFFPIHVYIVFGLFLLIQVIATFSVVVCLWYTHRLASPNLSKRMGDSTVGEHLQSK